MTKIIEGAGKEKSTVNDQSMTAEESRSWFKSLSREQKAQIRELNRIRPIWNLVILMYLVMWIVAAIIMVRFPVWPVRVPGYLVIGIAIHGLFNIMHEGIHGNLFRRKKLDRGVAYLMGVATLSSATAYRIVHLQHHRHNRTDKDPNEIANITPDKRLLSIVFYLALLLALHLMILASPILGYRLAGKQARRAVVLEYVSLVLIYGTLFWVASFYGALNQVGHLWGIPLLVAAAMGNVRGWAEHMLTIPGHPLTQSRTVTSKPIFAFFLTNSNYHLEHHLFPGMPWYNLPRLHVLLQEEYRKAGAFNYDAYWRFLWDALRAGVHGLAPSRVRHPIQPSAR